MEIRANSRYRGGLMFYVYICIFGLWLNTSSVNTQGPVQVINPDIGMFIVIYRVRYVVDFLKHCSHLLNIILLFSGNQLNIRSVA